MYTWCSQTRICFFKCAIHVFFPTIDDKQSALACSSVLVLKDIAHNDCQYFVSLAVSRTIPKTRFSKISQNVTLPTRKQFVRSMVVCVLYQFINKWRYDCQCPPCPDICLVRKNQSKRFGSRQRKIKILFALGWQCSRLAHFLSIRV